MKFIDILGLLLEKHDISRNKFCADLKIGKNSVVNWENRGNKPDGDTLIKIAKYFNVSVDHLLCETDDPTPIWQIKKTAAEKFSDDLKQIFIDAGDIKPGEELNDGLKEYMKDLVRSAVAKRLDGA